MPKPLWAPWRLEYVEGTEEAGRCVFCDPDEGLVVHRGEAAFVLLNRFPYTSGHLMVAPVRHEGDLVELTEVEALEIHRLATRAVTALREEYTAAATISAGISGALQVPGSSTTCTCTWCRDGPATPTSCRYSRTSGSSPRRSQRRPSGCGAASPLHETTRAETVTWVHTTRSPASGPLVVLVLSPA
jgi:hypothetical protein